MAGTLAGLVALLLPVLATARALAGIAGELSRGLRDGPDGAGHGPERAGADEPVSQTTEARQGHEAAAPQAAKEEAQPLGSPL